MTQRRSLLGVRLGVAALVVWALMTPPPGAATVRNPLPTVTISPDHITGTEVGP